jgi:phosphonate transport system permease protein
MADGVANGARRVFAPNWLARAAWVLLAVYVVYVLNQFDLSWARLNQGLGHAAKLIGSMLPPEVEDGDKLSLLLKGLAESLEIAILASALGIVLALPIGMCAARNLVPSYVSWLARGFIVLCRSFHPVIVAIVFVKAIGFGALAGIMALTVASVGFIAKLFAEAIEEISPRQVEAVRATGARFGQVLVMGVLPQVMARFVGFATYQLDSNLRNSTMVGIVGAGGIGGTLFAAFQRFEYDFVATILIAIIALIFAGEILSGWLRRMFQ